MPDLHMRRCVLRHAHAILLMAQCLQHIFPLNHCAHRLFLYVPAVRGARATLRAASSAFCFLDLAGISLLTAPTGGSQQAVVKLTESLAPLTQSVRLQCAVQAPGYLPVRFNCSCPLRPLLSVHFLPVHFFARKGTGPPQESNSQGGCLAMLTLLFSPYGQLHAASCNIDAGPWGSNSNCYNGRTK
jgi:hypothetical protein